MKKISFSILLLIFAFNVKAQVAKPFYFVEKERQTAYNDYSVHPTQTHVQINRGDSITIDVMLLKAEGCFQKAKVEMSITSQLPAGMTITFEPAKGILEQTKATIKTTNTIVPGIYSIIISAEIQMQHKGNIVDVEVL